MLLEEISFEWENRRCVFLIIKNLVKAKPVLRSLDTKAHWCDRDKKPVTIDGRRWMVNCYSVNWHDLSAYIVAMTIIYRMMTSDNDHLSNEESLKCQAIGYYLRQASMWKAEKKNVFWILPPFTFTDKSGTDSCWVGKRVEGKGGGEKLTNQQRP